MSTCRPLSEIQPQCEDDSEPCHHRHPVEKCGRVLRECSGHSDCRIHPEGSNHDRKKIYAAVEVIVGYDEDHGRQRCCRKWRAKKPSPANQTMPKASHSR